MFKVLSGAKKNLMKNKDKYLESSWVEASSNGKLLSN